MPAQYATRPHRTKGSWTPRLAGIGGVVVLVGGVLAVYLGTAHGQAPAVSAHHHLPPLTSKVASVQTVGLVDFGVYGDKDGNSWQNDGDDHPMMLLLTKGSTISFVRIPQPEIASGTPEWTADQLTDGTDIFIYVPTGQCLTAASGGKLSLAHCDLASDQRWRQLNSEVLLTEPIAQYANVSTGRCLTAPRAPATVLAPAPALLTVCAGVHSKRFKVQEIAFWWSA